MTRKVRNTAILAKIETTYGIDAVPTGAANALLISEATFDVPIAKPAAPEQMPAAGGSYVRLPDGTLQPATTAKPE